LGINLIGGVLSNSSTPQTSYAAHPKQVHTTIYPTHESLCWGSTDGVKYLWLYWCLLV